MKRVIGRGLVVVLLLIALALLVVGWYASSLALVPAPERLLAEFTVLDVSGFAGSPNGEVTLEVANAINEFADPSVQGYYNLLYEGGYGRLGAIIEEQPDQVRRQLSLVSGRAPQAGEEARVDVFYYRRNPAEDLGMPYQALELRGNAGTIRAWWLPNSPEAQRDTGSPTALPLESLAPNPSPIAIMMLHGRRRGRLEETLRMMPAMAQLGYPILSMSYRNHSDSVETGQYGYGSSEWQDAALGLQFLQEQGIRQVVLFGISMGGSVALELLEHYPDNAPQPLGLILDSPMVDTRSVLAHGAVRAGLPTALHPFIFWLGRQRSGIDWDTLDHRQTIGNYSLPILLIAGSNDQTIPISLIDDFANRVPNLWGYYRLEGAQHVTIWNHDPNRYTQWLQQFLQQVVPIPAPVTPAGS